MYMYSVKGCLAYKSIHRGCQILLSPVSGKAYSSLVSITLMGVLACNVVPRKYRTSNIIMICTISLHKSKVQVLWCKDVSKLPPLPKAYELIMP